MLICGWATAHAVNCAASYLNESINLYVTFSTDGPLTDGQVSSSIYTNAPPSEKQAFELSAHWMIPQARHGLVSVQELYLSKTKALQKHEFQKINSWLTEYLGQRTYILEWVVRWLDAGGVQVVAWWLQNKSKATESIKGIARNRGKKLTEKTRNQLQETEQNTQDIRLNKPKPRQIQIRVEQKQRTPKTKWQNQTARSDQNLNPKANKPQLLYVSYIYSELHWHHS